uniref:Outer capsid protein VP4 n=1 Tax=Rotavirus C (strain RVC/Pig/United States/Cowden/1980) TaxID=10916 RepID=VP4_ROTPC|nr:RecName: Full=Outer capsid protein VP4; AltName: Full=Hemagglutinin; Contains: RecName: Full=Outer capsid protein VP8*; Contains: RecName: Full=Outer capsid protein VP5* [Porcine rotavirus C strain Cowden]AAB00802.1 outer capsid protein [Porcine rotavirus C]
MASSLYQQLISQNYYSIGNEILTDQQTTETVVDYVDAGNYTYAQLPPTKWGARGTFKSAFNVSNITGPHTNTIIEWSNLLNSNGWVIYQKPANTTKLFKHGPETYNSNLAAFELWYGKAGTSVTSDYYSSLQNNEKTVTATSDSLILFWNEGSTVLANKKVNFSWDMGGMLIKPTRGNRVDICMANMNDFNSSIFNWEEWKHEFPRSDVNINVNMYTDYYLASEDPYTELKALQQPNITTFEMKMMKIIRNGSINLNEVVSKDSLWQEVRYARDITLECKIESEVVKGGGWGYDYTSVAFKTVNHTYTYTRAGEIVNAHVTISFNNMKERSYGGSLPTDFKIGRFDVIDTDTYMYIDYWDDSEIFKNMVYVRDLSANIGGFFYYAEMSYYFQIPVGAHPGLHSSGVRFVYERCLLSQQFTDQVALNSMRFIFRVTESNGWFMTSGNINTRRIASGTGFAYADGHTSQTVGNITFISLIPSNPNYQTPIASSSTVRMDLERKINDLRNDFNQLANSVALGDILSLATSPLTFANLLESVPAIASSVKDVAANVMKKFRNTKMFKKATKAKYSEFIIGDLLEDVTNVARNSNGMNFDDITSAVMVSTTNKLQLTDVDTLSEIVARSADNFIPNRSYRMIEDGIVYEATPKRTFSYDLTTLQQREFDIDKFMRLASKSPVISAIVDFATLKAMRETYGVGTDVIYKLVASDAPTILSFIDNNNPLIKSRIEELLRQCRL